MFLQEMTNNHTGTNPYFLNSFKMHAIVCIQEIDPEKDLHKIKCCSSDKHGYLYRHD